LIIRFKGSIQDATGEEITVRYHQVQPTVISVQEARINPLVQYCDCQMLILISLTLVSGWSQPRMRRADRSVAAHCPRLGERLCLRNIERRRHRAPRHLLTFVLLRELARVEHLDGGSGFITTLGGMNRGIVPARTILSSNSRPFRANWRDAISRQWEQIPWRVLIRLLRQHG
jgi:hypothetical protein